MADIKISGFDYSEFFHFFETFKGQSFRNIDPDDTAVFSLEKKLNDTGQFFFIMDLIQLSGLYFSNGAYSFFGVSPGQIDPAVMYAAIHPEDIKRFSNARAKLIKMGMEVFNKQLDRTFLSSNFRVKNSEGQYVDLLFQDCVCHAGPQTNKVYVIQVHTNITGIINSRFGYHYYVGPDLSHFRYPDNDYLKIGNIFTKSEWLIINYIAEGLDSDQIAKKLFLSKHTINRHRQNILKKTGKRNTYDLLIELQERGLI